MRIESISQLHEVIGYGKPLHPLITAIDYSKVKLTSEMTNISVVTTLYSIAFKSNVSGKLFYGRGTYDFEEGALVFIGPEQFVEQRDDSPEPNHDGWGLYFHPDLIRGHAINDKMHEYSFFGYEANEALHVSDRERQSIENVVKSIKNEYSQNPDDFSIEIILSNLELLLGYCKRFYSRQFNTRTSVNQDVVSNFTALLHQWYKEDMARQHGMPKIKYFSEKLNYSPNYLGDILKKKRARALKIISMLISLIELKTCLLIGNLR